MLEEDIRNLAKSSRYQHLYRNAKDIPSLQLFENNSNLSGLQILFLYWVRIYHIMYDELSKKDHELLDDDVINDHIRLDAFLYYRQRQLEKELQKRINEEKTRKYDKGSGKITHREFPIYRGTPVNNGAK